MEKSDAYRKGSGSGKKWDGGGPGGGPYGGGPGGPRGPRGGLDNVRGLDSIRGNDHSKFTSIIPFDFEHFSTTFLVKMLWFNSQVLYLPVAPAAAECGHCAGT